MSRHADLEKGVRSDRLAPFSASRSHQAEATGSKRAPWTLGSPHLHSGQLARGVLWEASVSSSGRYGDRLPGGSAIGTSLLTASKDLVQSGSAVTLMSTTVLGLYLIPMERLVI